MLFDSIPFATLNFQQLIFGGFLLSAHNTQREQILQFFIATRSNWRQDSIAVSYEQSERKKQVRTGPLKRTIRLYFRARVSPRLKHIGGAVNS